MIFSQASELLERQSSMASSTECVSGPGNDVSTEQSKHDTTDTEQRYPVIIWLLLQRLHTILLLQVWYVHA